VLVHIAQMRSGSGALVGTAHRNGYVSSPNVSELLEFVGKGLLLRGQAVRRVSPVLVNLNEAPGLRTRGPISSISAIVSLVWAIAFAALGRGVATAILLMSQCVAAATPRHRAVGSSVALALALSTLSLGARLCKVARFTAQTALDVSAFGRLARFLTVCDHMPNLAASATSLLGAIFGTVADLSAGAALEVSGGSGARKDEVAVDTAARTDELFGALVGAVALHGAVEANTGRTSRGIVAIFAAVHTLAFDVGPVCEARSASARGMVVRLAIEAAPNAYGELTSRVDVVETEECVGSLDGLWLLVADESTAVQQ